MVEISLSGSEGAPGGQLPGATREYIGFGVPTLSSQSEGNTTSGAIASH
jgi:hypothetical protein